MAPRAVGVPRPNRREDVGMRIIKILLSLDASLWFVLAPSVCSQSTADSAAPILFRHDDEPPFNYHAWPEWGWDANTREFVSSSQDITGGTRLFRSQAGWIKHLSGLTGISRIHQISGLCSSVWTSVAFALLPTRRAMPGRRWDAGSCSRVGTNR